jgi:hypothetical protein
MEAMGWCNIGPLAFLWSPVFSYKMSIAKPMALVHLKETVRANN